MQKISVSFNKDLRSLPLSFLGWNLFCVAHNFEKFHLMHSAAAAATLHFTHCEDSVVQGSLNAFKLNRNKT